MSNEPTPQEPVEVEGDVLEWPPDPDFTPTPIPEQDLTPVEVDEDYSPSEEGEG